MGKLQNQVRGSINMVLEIEGVIEHRADQFLFMQGGLARLVDISHVGQPADIFYEEFMDIIGILI